MATDPENDSKAKPRWRGELDDINRLIPNEYSNYMRLPKAIALLFAHTELFADIIRRQKWDVIPAPLTFLSITTLFPNAI
jgi:hypothetical protein